MTHASAFIPSASSSRVPAVVPAVAPVPLYTSRACKGGALLADTRTLLRAWKTGESAIQLEHRAITDDLLGKATLQRTHDVVRRVFAPRFLISADQPACWLKTLLEARPAGDWFRDLSLLYAARADLLLRDTLVLVVPDALARGYSRIDVAHLELFLKRAEQQGRMRTHWSESVRHRVAVGLASLMSDFGLASTPRGGSREILRFRPSSLAVAFLAFELHFAGNTDLGVLEHPDWRIWQLDRDSVRQQLDELSSHGLWIFQAAGSVVRIHWTFHSMEEAVDALARLDLR